MNCKYLLDIPEMNQIIPKLVQMHDPIAHEDFIPDWHPNTMRTPVQRLHINIVKF